MWFYGEVLIFFLFAPFVDHWDIQGHEYQNWAKPEDSKVNFQGRGYGIKCYPIYFSLLKVFYIVLKYC
jgi:hypothetical protein